MRNWRPLDIRDKDIINTFLHQKRYETSELTFTNLLLWRFGHKLQWRVVHDMLLIRMVNEHGEPGYYIPIGGGDLAAAVESLIAEPGVFRLVSLSQRMVDELEAASPGRLSFTRTRAYDDYIYSIEELRDLPGARFRKKRNFVNGFERDNPNYRYARLTLDSIPDVVLSQLEWCDNRDCEHYPQLYKEKIGVLKILEHFEELDYTGAFIEVGVKVEAFSFGEKITDDTVVIHIEKANEAIRGAYQAINAMFLREWPDAKYVNRECDLGLEGLRKAKESYRPVKMLEKFEARLSE